MDGARLTQKQYKTIRTIIDHTGILRNVKDFPRPYKMTPKDHTTLNGTNYQFVGLSLCHFEKFNFLELLMKKPLNPPYLRYGQKPDLRFSKGTVKLFIYKRRKQNTLDLITGFIDKFQFSDSGADQQNLRECIQQEPQKRR